MRLNSLTLLTGLAIIASANAQPTTSQPTAVPRLMRFNGSLQVAGPRTQIAVVGATFSIYREEHDGTPLWSEIQNIQPDKDGNYTALLGSTRVEGMPADLFTSAEPRWLEVEIDQARKPRMLLGSVPYAFKAIDADTLGGLPPSAYLRASPPNAAASPAPTFTNLMASALSPLANSGSPNCISMFLNSTDLICSSMAQSLYQGNAAVSIGAAAYLGAMTLVGNVPQGDAAGMALYNTGGGPGASVSLDMYNTQFNSGIPQAKIKALDDGNYSDHLTFWTKAPGGPGNAVAEKVRITSTGNVGIGTTTPAAKLEVNGSLMVDGNITFTGAIQSTGGMSLFQAPATGSNFGVGLGALQSVTTGTLNTASGDGALTVNTAGHDNTASGYQALASNLGGNFNTATGSGALHSNTTNGNGNTANGYQALYNNTTASFNTADGYQALFSNTLGYHNTANGYQALFKNIGSSITGDDNTASGFQALFSNTSGYDNTAIGSSALSIANGNSNTAVGYNAGVAVTSGNNNTALGANAGSNVSTGSNNIHIGNAGTATDSALITIGTPGIHTAAFIAGIRGATTSQNNAIPVVIDSNGQLGTISSSRRFKKDIEDMGESTADLMRLRPVTFRYRQPFADGSEPIQYGLIAEEVAEVYPDLVAHSSDGQIETVKYQVLDSMLLNEVQRLYKQNREQEDKIHSLEERLSRLESRLER